MDQPFAGKVAIVTGAGNGIGRAEALEFARRGAAVVVNDLARSEPTAAEKVVAEIRDAGGTALAANGSVSKAETVKAIVETAMDNFGRVDFLVNNAGFGRMGPIWELAQNDWDAVIAVNLTGTFLMVREVAPIMRAQQFGAIVNTASEAATGETYFSCYAAAKAGVIGFTRAAARDLLRDNVRVNAITPRAFDTAQTNGAAYQKIQAFNARYGVAMCGPHPMGPISGTGAEVAAITAWLCTEDARDVTGRIVVAGCGEVGIWAEPDVDSPMINMEGWTLESLRAVSPYLAKDQRQPFRDLPPEAWAEIDERHSNRIANGAAAKARAGGG